MLKNTAVFCLGGGESVILGFDKNQQIRMKHIALPDNIDRPLEFYLAMEEFVAREIDEDSAFFFGRRLRQSFAGATN